MGIFATVEIGGDVELPHFPESLDHTTRWWQSKRGLDLYEQGPYKITKDGRLLLKQRTYREKTDEEKQAEAEKWGLDSWDSFVTCYEESGGMLIPDEVYWSDQDYHGAFEAHASGKREEDWPDVFFSYEFRFSNGELDEIVLLGERGTSEGVQEVIEKLDEWTDE
jgi:hypothetical protein